MTAVAGETVTGPVALARELSPRFAADAAERDRDRSFPAAQLEELRKSGLCALYVPTDVGGLGDDIHALTGVLSALAEGDSSIAQMFLIHVYGVALVNGVHCPDEVRNAYYRRLIDDGMIITNAFSEVGGKTVFDYSVSFEPTDSGDWRISGTKFYCTGSMGGDVFYVLGLCPGDPDPIFRVALVERDADGFIINDDWSGMGQRTTASGSVEFNDVVVSSDVVFDIDHFGTPESLFGSLGQCMFASVFTGIAKAALTDACEYVRTRSRPWPHAEVEKATDDPYVIHTIGRMQTLTSSAEAMLERAADVRVEAIAEETAEARDRASVAAAEAKIICGETALEVSELLFQVCGAGAVLEKYGYDRHWRNARTLTLHDPMAYKIRLVGDFALNGTSPPISVYT